jgi:hypothetical protein
MRDHHSCAPAGAGGGVATQLTIDGGFRGLMRENFRYLVYLNNRAAGKGSVKTIDLCDQKTAP